MQSCPAGQRAGVVSVACVAIQVHRASPEQATVSAWLPHGSAVAHTAAGQSAPAGQAMAVQAQAAPAAWQSASVAWAPHGSATSDAASGWVGGVSARGAGVSGED